MKPTPYSQPDYQNKYLTFEGTEFQPDKVLATFKTSGCALIRSALPAKELIISICWLSLKVLCHKDSVVQNDDSSQ